MKKTVISLSVIVAAMSFGTMSEVCAAKKIKENKTEKTEKTEKKSSVRASKVVTDKEGNKLAVVGRDPKGNPKISLHSAAFAAAVTQQFSKNTPVSYIVTKPSKPVGDAIQAAAVKSGASIKTDSKGAIHVSGTAAQVAPTQEAAAGATAPDPFTQGGGLGTAMAVAAMAGMLNSSPPSNSTKVTADQDLDNNLDNDLDNDRVTMNNNAGTLSGMSVSGGHVTITQSPPSVNVRLGVRTDVTDANEPYPGNLVYPQPQFGGPGVPVLMGDPNMYPNID